MYINTCIYIFDLILLNINILIKYIFFFNKVQLEIDERRNFLSEIEKHGQGAKFRPLIETEISQVRPRN